MGNTPFSQRIASYSCCGSKSVPEQRDIDREILQSMITHKTNETPKQKNKKLESIPEEIKVEQYEIDKNNMASSFNFTQWIKDNELNDIKHIFIKYKMTTISSLSNQTNLYRNFIVDTQLTYEYSYLMEKAVNAIHELNVKYNTNKINNENKNNEINLDKLRQKSLELCSDNFSIFIDNKLNKIIDKLWKNKLDRNNKGYIESIEDISEGIAFVALVYKQHLHKKQHKQDNKPFNLEKEQLQINQQAKQIAVWVCYSYGENDTYRLTKREFQSHLPEWIREYAKADGAT
eukprot:9758_1